MKPTFEHARKSLAFLEHHQLEPSASNYDLALNYVTNASSDLSLEIDAQTEGGVRLAYAAAAELIDRYLLRNPKVVIGDRERTVAWQAEKLGTLTYDAHEVTSALERDVGTIVIQANEWPKATNDFVARLSDAERELAELRSNVKKLQIQIAGREDIQEDIGRDALTHALNQTGAQSLLEAFTGDARDYVLIMFSVDDLVELNENFGRSVGDNILDAFAATLRQFFQEQELIRWSGNEFVTVMRDTALMAARLIAEEALVAMADRRLKLRESGDWIGVVTASAGIVVSQNEAITDVLERARANVLAAAALGGNKLKG